MRDLFKKKSLKVINIGLKGFYDDLKSQGVEVVHVDWKPPLGGEEELGTP